MNSIPTVQPLSRGRSALIVAGVLALLGWFAAPAHAGYYGDYGYGGPCSYRCGYRPYYPVYRHYGCYSCGRRVVYERRYIEREYVERRVGYGYGGYHCHYGYYSPCGYHRHYGYYGGYRPYGYGYGFPGVGRRWPLPFDGYGAYGGPYAAGYDGPPRPPAPVLDEGYE